MWMPFRMLDVLATLAKILTGAQGVWVGATPDPKQKVYFANHTSNLDTIIIWSALPNKLRGITRPVAAKDYWDQPGVRRHIATKELNVVFVERQKETRTEDPLNPLRRALNEGYSLIIFPEGKRNPNVIPGEFKSGIYWLAKEYPNVDFVPVYLENVAKTFPRGAFFPLPIICKAFFGPPIKKVQEVTGNLSEKEGVVAYLNNARRSVINLIPDYITKAQPNFEKMVQDGESHVKVPVVEVENVVAIEDISTAIVNETNEGKAQ
jgi:1-acyl-sn-glycerol-3-phosphate acyltransferase